MFPTRSNRAAPESCLLFLLPLGEFWKLCHSKVYVHHPEGLRSRTRVERCNRASRQTRLGHAVLPPRKAEFQDVASAALPPAKTRPRRGRAGPFRAASKSYEAGLQPGGNHFRT